MTITTEELKPCPFCGGEAEWDIYSQHGISWSIDSAQIKCSECEIQTETVWVRDNLNKQSCEQAFIEATKIWNARV